MSEIKVSPHELLSVCAQYCDYTGEITNGKIVITPYDHFVGIVCIDDKVKDALKSTYDYCIEKIFFL